MTRSYRTITIATTTASIATATTATAAADGGKISPGESTNRKGGYDITHRG